MVPFAGYEMPVLYPDGVLKEHLFCRESCGLFDVSHMGQLNIIGKDAAEFLEYITVADIRALPKGSGTLSLITNKDGGIMDDTIITKDDNEKFFVVVNGACKDKDFEHMIAIRNSSRFNDKDITIKMIDEYSLIAIQGPKSMQILHEILGISLVDMDFMTSRKFELKNSEVKIRISRCGYTGEDGFEISIPD